MNVTGPFVDVGALLFRLRHLYAPRLSVRTTGCSSLFMTLESRPNRWSVASEWADVRADLARRCPLICPPEWVR